MIDLSGRVEASFDGCSNHLTQKLSESLQRRTTIQHWYQAYADHYDQDFTAEADRIAVDETQIQLEHEQKALLYAAIDVDTKVVL